MDSDPMDDPLSVIPKVPFSKEQITSLCWGKQGAEWNGLCRSADWNTHRHTGHLYPWQQLSPTSSTKYFFSPFPCSFSFSSCTVRILRRYLQMSPGYDLNSLKLRKESSLNWSKDVTQLLWSSACRLATNQILSFFFYCFHIFQLIFIQDRVHSQNDDSYYEQIIDVQKTY